MTNLFVSNIKMLFRDKQLIFWSLMFPLMFTFIFGFFFGKGSTSTGAIAVINKSNSEISKSLEKGMEDSKLFKLQKESDLDTSKDMLKKNKVGAVLVIPEGFGDLSPSAPTQIKVIYDPGNTQTNSIVTSFINSYLTSLNFQVNNIKPTYSLDEEKTNTNQLGYFDFVLVGLMGMALMNSSIQGISISMSKYREDKILKRITTTPLPSWRFIVSFVLSRLVVNILQISLILLVGIYAFDAHIYGNLFLIYFIAMICAVLFQLIGFAIAGMSKTTAAAEGMSTAIAIPMMFLAGVFFPIDQLPRWLYSIVQYLPLAPLLRILRSVTLEASSPFENLTNVVIVLSWLVITLVLASFKFKLSEE